MKQRSGSLAGHVGALLALLAALLGVPSPARAHPIPRDNHDRTLIVRLTPEALLVSYRLELDDGQALRDFPPEELPRLTGRSEFFPLFTRYYGPVLANNVVASLDGQPLTLTCTERRFQLPEPQHLICDFQFRAPWAPDPGRAHAFRVYEGNYHDDDFSQMRLTLAAGFGVALRDVQAPGAALMARPPQDRRPGDGRRLRTASARFTLVPAEQKGIDKPGLPPPDEPPRRGPRPRRPAAFARPASAAEVAAFDKPSVYPPGRAADPAGEAVALARPHALLHLLFDSRRGFVVLLLLAAGFGAAHALTPGHGKTMVAAYLVGERGTVWHALLLGLVTTLTHTGAVLLLAALLPLCFPKAAQQATVQSALGLVGGLLIAGIGLWLLTRRLSGGADHFHIGGGHHHHHHHDHAHGHHHPHHHDHAPAHDHPAAGSSEKPGVRKWELIALGVSGGIVPCWDAILLLGVAVSAQRLGLALPLLLAFSAGLASVLIAIGIGVVYARRWAGSRWGTSFGAGGARALPILSAVVITALGLWLCYDSVQQGKAAPSSVARSQE